MYIYSVSTNEYKDPWDTSFAARFEQLVRGQKHVAYYYERPDSSTFRYRVYNMIQSLQETGNRVSASFFKGEELEYLDRIVDHADVLVICRSNYSKRLNRMITKARKMGKKVFFDIDDLVFNPLHVHFVLDCLNQDLDNPIISNYWFAYFGMQAAIMDLCDEVITTNGFLAERIRAHSGKPTWVIPNFMNREQMEISERIFEAKRADGFKRNDQIHLGYFSGSHTHSKDLMVAADALSELLEKYQNIVLRIVGFMDLPESLQRFKSRIERYPIQNFMELQRLIGEVEINIVPLQDNEFTNCKSELKYFEAGAVGTISLASPTFTYTQSIQDGENGFLAKSYEWLDRLESLICEVDSLSSIARQAHHHSMTKFAWYNQARLIETTIFP